MLIDTHCHINMIVKKKFDALLTNEELKNAQAVIDAAKANDVLKIINVGTSLGESMNCVELARSYPECYAAIGIHPNDTTKNWKDDLHRMKKQWFTNNDYKGFFKIVALGEIGLDKHYPGFDIQLQEAAFREQIEFALCYELPIIVHTRDAQDSVLKIIEKYKKDNLKGVIHCFSEDLSFAQHAIELGFVLGIGGTLTYPKNELLRQIFSGIPLDKIILETDAPFLPPQAIRGKQNNPAQIKTIAEFLADLRKISLQEVADTTSKTAQRLFGL